MAGDGNWIKLHRKSLDSRVFSDARLWQFWCWLLMSANWKPSWFAKQEIGIGQIAFSQSRVADEVFEVHRNTVGRWLTELHKWGMIEREKRGSGVHQFTVVTICNWKTYQVFEKSDVASDVASGCASEDLRVNSNASESVLTTYNHDEKENRKSGHVQSVVHQEGQLNSECETTCNVDGGPHSATDVASDVATDGAYPKKVKNLKKEERAAPPLSDFHFPLKDGTTWSLTVPKLREYEETYRGRLDVRLHLSIARQWCRDNKEGRKTAKGMPKFLSSWLARDAIKSRAGPNGKPSPPDPTNRPLPGMR